MGVAGAAVVPGVFAEWAQVNAAGDSAAIVIDDVAAVAVEYQRHAAGRAAHGADPNDHVRDGVFFVQDRPLFAATDVEQIAGVQDFLACLVIGR